MRCTLKSTDANWIFGTWRQGKMGANENNKKLESVTNKQLLTDQYLVEQY